MRNRVVFASTLDTGLRSEVNNQLGELGVSEYSVEAYHFPVSGRVVAAEEQYNEEFVKKFPFVVTLQNESSKYVAMKLKTIGVAEVVLL